MTHDINRHDESDAQPLVDGGMINLRTLVGIVTAHAPTMIIAAILGVSASIVYLHLATKKFAVRLEITAAAPSMQGHNSALSALSSLAGLSLEAGSNPQFSKFLGALRSPIAAEAIAEDQKLLRAIFPRDWSVRNHGWQEPKSRFRPIAYAVKRFLGMDVRVWTPPGIGEVYQYLNSQLKIIPDAKSGVVTLEIDSSHPEVTKPVLVALNDAIDEWTRKHDLAHATTDIRYLSKKLSAVTVEDYRKALVANLAEQEKARMFASAPLPYVSDALGTPMVSLRPLYPKPLAVLAAGLILGTVAGFVIARFKHRRR